MFMWYQCRGVLDGVFILHNALRPRQNGRHFPDDIYKYIFLNENIWILIKISLISFPRVELTIFQHWFRYWLGADQATSHYLNQWWLVYRRIYASHGLNEIMIFIFRQFLFVNFLRRPKLSVLTEISFLTQRLFSIYVVRCLWMNAFEIPEINIPKQQSYCF